MLAVSLVVVADVSSAILHTMGGSTGPGDNDAEHGAVCSPSSGVTATMPTENDDKGALTSVYAAGCVHKCADRSTAGIVKCSGGGASPEGRRHSTTTSTAGVMVAVCT